MCTSEERERTTDTLGSSTVGSIGLDGRPVWVVDDGAEEVELDEGARSRPSNGSSVVSSPSSGIVRGASPEHGSGVIGGEGGIELGKGVCNGADSSEGGPSDFGGELSSPPVEEELAARLDDGRAAGDGNGCVRFLRDAESGDARERNRSAMLALTVGRDRAATELNNQPQPRSPRRDFELTKGKDTVQRNLTCVVRSRIV